MKEEERAPIRLLAFKTLKEYISVVLSTNFVLLLLLQS
jgi:hypothetical protein